MPNNNRKNCGAAAVIVLLALFCLACPSSPPPPTPPTPPVPVVTVLGPTEIWLTPDIGSADLLQMFSSPDAWVKSRAKVKVWKWYTQQLLASDPCPICGPNRLPALITAGAFSKLKAWGIEQAVEVAVIKEWGCSASITFPYTKTVIDAVNQNGGTVSRIQMDEPLWGDTGLLVNGKGCATTLPHGTDLVSHAKSETMTYIQTMKATYPGLKVGDIEPYPVIPAPQIAGWIQFVPMDSFLLDVDMNLIGPNFGSDLKLLSTMCRSKKIPFGIIFDANPGPGVDWITQQKGFIARVLHDFGTPDQSIFQSWYCQGPYQTPGPPCITPANLPESGNTMLNVILNSTR